VPPYFKAASAGKREQLKEQHLAVEKMIEGKSLGVRVRLQRRPALRIYPLSR
jgi:hypothetical protein